MRRMFWVAAIIWMVVIFVFSNKDADASGKQSGFWGMALGRIVYSDFDEWPEEDRMAFAERVDFPIRKAAHATEYAVLGFLLAGAFGDSVERRWRRLTAGQVEQKGATRPQMEWFIGVIVVWAFASLYGVTDEIHQSFVPGRACQVRDMVIDSAGALIGVVIGKKLGNKRGE